MIAKSYRPFNNGEFIKDCIEMFVDETCPEKGICLKIQVFLALQSFTRRIGDLSQDIENALEMKISQCKLYRIASDESTDISDTAQLSVFITGNRNNFEVTEELLDMCSMCKQQQDNTLLTKLKRFLKNSKYILKNFVVSLLMEQQQ